jgi:hypothetical protein
MPMAGLSNGAGSRPALANLGSSATNGGPLGPTLLGRRSEELQAGGVFGTGMPSRWPSRTGAADDSLTLEPAGSGALAPGDRRSLLHSAGKSGSFKLRGIDLGPWIMDYDNVARGK